MDMIHLIGADSVSNAGHAIERASSDMMRAASSIETAVFHFTQQIDRLEQLLERAINELPQGG
jgi:hypothetical protein